jgi:hypothetical protein
MTRLPLATLVVLVLAFATAAANPGGTNVVINEIYCDGAGYYDGSEFIELYNPTASPIDIQGWVLTGTEYDETCGGEDLWQFPLGSPIMIPAGGFIVVAKDGDDSADPPNDDSFAWEFGFYPDFEQYDSSASFDIDSPFVANLDLLTPDPATTYSDEIQLVGGRGYGVICSAPTSDSDVVYLYDGDPSVSGVLVDLVEYVDPTQCSTDPCGAHTIPPWIPDDGADDNAYQGIPYLGNTLGRSAGGVDTDNSINDWTLQAPTPGATNVVNTPPWIRNLQYSPIPPTESEDTIISAFVTDDGTIDSVMVYYNVENTGWHRLTASASDSLYSAAIPNAALTDFDIVDYFMRAVDNYGATMNYPAGAMSDPYSYRVGVTPIQQVQFANAGGDTSQLYGQPVNVQGVVTMASGVMRDDLFFIQDAAGANHGIACYMPGTPTTVQEGDLVTFCGYVSEYYGMTEVNRHFTESMDIISSGNAIVYTDVSSAAIAPANPAAEDYEGVLVSIDDLTVTFESDVYGSWYARDASAVDLKVDDYAYYSYDAEVLDTIAELRGILIYDFNEYKVQPRYDADIIGPPRVGDVRYSPVPPSNASQTTITAIMQDDVDITTATLYWSYAKARPYPNSVAMTESARYENAWTANIPAQSNGTRVYYYVHCEDGTMDAEKPAGGGYSYYTGIATIQSVQEVPPGGDVSPMDTLAVNVEGYVTAEPGIFNANTFYIQEDTGAWHGILVYDRTGTVSFNRGDYVVACGEVTEYYGQTQLELHFSDAVHLATPARPEAIAPVSIATGLLQNVVSAEQYESVYVYAEDCTVYDDDVAFGEWAISNGTASDTCRVGDFAEYDYAPNVGDNVYVKGPVAFSFGLYKIEPRGNEDIAANPAGVQDDVFGGKFGLAQNAPNPFNPKTTIAFNIVKAGDVKLEVFDVAGRRVVTLVNGHLDAGPHEARWNGMTATGDRAASGVYFYKLTAGDGEISKKMVLLK